MAKSHDGSDFKHRQRILPHYQLTALVKKRLKFVMILHLLIGFLMAVKLLPTVLDMLNIFWEPLEELYVPLAQPWEWIWFGSLLITMLSFRSIRTNNVLQLKLFLVAILGTCIFPLLYCAYIYYADFRTYVITKDAQKCAEVWQNYPVALYWYIYIGVAMQIHVFEIYFGWELLNSIGNQRSTSNKIK